MLPHRTQIFTWLLVLWLLLLPSGAPWLHTVVDISCCATSKAQSTSTKCCHHHHRDGGDSDGTAKCVVPQAEDHGLPLRQPAPHDCSNCPVCQAIAAPRVLALVVELTVFPERTELISVIECADPLLGFGLPLQCRAPPVA